jgi:exoribonuclease R
MALTAAHRCTRWNCRREPPACCPTKSGRLWSGSLRLDSSGSLISTNVSRARIRNRAKLSYQDVQRSLDAGTAGEMLSLLPEIGRLRQDQERARCGVSLPVPRQEIVSDNSGFRLEYEAPLPVEGCNAQLSLLTGMAAAALMRHGRGGHFPDPSSGATA